MTKSHNYDQKSLLWPKVITMTKSHNYDLKWHWNRNTTNWLCLSQYFVRISVFTITWLSVTEYPISCLSYTQYPVCFIIHSWINSGRVIINHHLWSKHACLLSLFFFSIDIDYRNHRFIHNSMYFVILFLKTWL
jgi:hypothetical protein